MFDILSGAQNFRRIWNSEERGNCYANGWRVFFTAFFIELKIIPFLAEKQSWLIKFSNPIFERPRKIFFDHLNFGQTHFEPFFRFTETKMKRGYFELGTDFTYFFLKNEHFGS